MGSVTAEGPRGPLTRGCFCLVVIKSPPDWEVGVYAAGALALLGIAAVSLWKLWTSGSFPSPSPFPNYNYRYLQQKYGETYAEARQKVRLLLLFFLGGDPLLANPLLPELDWQVSTSPAPP